MLDSRQSFKAGFLLRCAEEGLTREETEARISLGLEKVAGWGTDSVKTLAGTGGGLISGLSLASLLGVFGAGAVGGAGGITAAKLTEPDMNTEEAKTHEMIAALQYHAENARRSTARRALRPDVRRPRAPQLSF